MNGRYEMKYLVSHSQAEAIAHYLGPILTFDRFSEKHPGGYYPISSLYWDTQDLRLCRESLEGKKNRFKLRVRSYCDGESSPIFVEIKRRMNAIIIKDRARAPRQAISALLEPGDDVWSGENDDETMRQFQLYLHSLYARPKVLIRYWRKAYLAGTEGQVRITFDRDLGFKQTSEPRVELGGDGWQPVPLNGQVLEIKFTGAYPAWLEDMVRQFGLRAQSVSKYTLSLRRASQLRFCAPVLEQLS